MSGREGRRAYHGELAIRSDATDARSDEDPSIFCQGYRECSPKLCRRTCELSPEET